LNFLNHSLNEKHHSRNKMTILLNKVKQFLLIKTTCILTLKFTTVKDDY